MAKSDKIVQLKKDEAVKKESHVIQTIENMALAKEEITFTTVYKKAGVSKGNVYQNQNIRQRIEYYINNPTRPKRTLDSKDVIIDMQKQRIAELEDQVKRLEKTIKEDGDYKAKYKKAMEENRELRKQLSVAYKY